MNNTSDGVYASKLAFKMPFIIADLTKDGKETTVSEITLKVCEIYGLVRSKNLTNRVRRIINQQSEDGALETEVRMHQVYKNRIIIIKGIK